MNAPALVELAGYLVILLSMTAWVLRDMRALRRDMAESEARWKATQAELARLLALTDPPPPTGSAYRDPPPRIHDQFYVLEPEPGRPRPPKPRPAKTPPASPCRPPAKRCG